MKFNLKKYIHPIIAGVSILGIIVLIIVLIPVLPIIIQGIVWVIALPFKLISSLFKAIFKKKE